MAGRLGLNRLEALLEQIDRDLNLANTTLTNPTITTSATATFTGIVQGTTTATHGAGATSTEVAPSTTIMDINGEVRTQIKVDLTGLKKKSDVGDVIGLDGVTNASLLQYSSATHGKLHRIELHWVEAPTAATNNLLDIDVIGHASILDYDGDASGGTDLYTAGGNTAVVGTTLVNETMGTVADDLYIYLCDGATSTSADVFTAGKVVITLWGHKTF